MANEFKHGSVGTELTQAEWEGIGTHVFSSQATGDLAYASSATQLSRLAISGTATHILSISGGVPAWAAPAAAAAGSLTGATLASGVTASSLTSVGTIATGVWQGTDVGVAYGGTGVSTLTDGGILLGSGASAITAMAVLADSEMIVGNGSTDPVAESGATLRTSIGVGTGDSPQFTELTLTGDLDLTDNDLLDAGKVLIGYTAAVLCDNGVLPPLQMHGDALTDTGQLWAHWSADTIGVHNRYVKSRGAMGVNTAVLDGDSIMHTRWIGADGSGTLDTPAASMSVNVDGAPAASKIPGRIVFETTPVGANTLLPRLRINNGGDIFIGLAAASGNSTNAHMTTGLTINQEDADNEILAFKSSDVSQPVTDNAEADTYAMFQKSNATEGGLHLAAYNEGTTTETTPFHLFAIHGGTPVTTDTSASRSIIRFTGAKANGTAAQAAAATENVLAIDDGNSTRWIIKGNGDVHQTTDAHTALDDYPDAIVGRAGRQVVAKGNLEGAGRSVDSKFADILEERGIMNFNRDSDSVAFVNIIPAIFHAWDMGFQLHGWMTEIVDVLTPRQRAQLPTEMLTHLKALEA